MIKFLVDTSSDYNIEEIKAKGLEVVPIAISFEEEHFLDGIDIDSNTFYEKLNTSAELPKTSQPSPHAFEKIFKKSKENGDEIIAILLSSELSGTAQSANIAKQMVDYDGIHIVDSLTATAAIRMITEAGIKLLNEGKNASEIVENLEQLKSKVKILAALDTLENLYKGGRLSKIEAGVGSLAKIKPMITISEDGKVAVVGKCIGKKKAVATLSKMAKEKKIDKNYPIYGIYSYGRENQEIFEKSVNEMGIEFEGVYQTGATIGTHIGSGAYGFIYVEE